MKNKEIQEARIKGYFIEATRNILKGEGLKALSVRSVADQAGYSYATMYNYFKDINELVFVCVSDFQEEIKNYVDDKISTDSGGLQQVNEATRAWLAYFLEYPGIFELFYVVRGGDFGNKKSILEVIDTSMERACENAWNGVIKSGIMDANVAEFKKARLKYVLIGLLVMFMNRRTPESYTDFILESNRQIDQILGQ
ncbi:MAG: TetR/AcrR family transcriptional regulator [Bacteroidales bacterium]|nr:TetR/AcrR family transcriptional regulator [Bacteroidales bacterium]